MAQADYSKKSLYTQIKALEGGTEGVTLAQDKILIGGTDNLAAAKAITGAITLDHTGATTIPLADGKVLIGGSGGVAAAQTLSGPVAISNAGVTSIGLADGKVLIGDSGGAAAAQTLSGDITITRAGVASIGAGRVTSGMWSSGAGVAAFLTAGLGASGAYVKTTNGAQTLLAQNASARVALIMAVVTEVFADGDGGQPVFAIGETSTPNKFDAGTAFTNASAGTVKFFAGTLTGTKALLVTGTPATGTGTGAIAVTAIVLPASS